MRDVCWSLVALFRSFPGRARWARPQLSGSAAGTNIEVAYWREGNLEVDFVLRNGNSVTAIEVKSGRRRESLPGMEAFCRAFEPRRNLLVGGQGIPLEEFLLTPVSRYVEG